MNQPARRQPDRTRQTLLECAFEEMHRSGFRAASLDAILESSGVTKGALYHHFGSKTALGYAVVEEVVRPWVEASWRPVLEADDCIAAAVAVCQELTRQRTVRAIEYGCPFNNLINEMSPVDEGFRKRLQQILDDWREGIVAALRKGQAQGVVRADVVAEDAAAFIISAVEGCVGMAKSKRSREFLESGMRGLIAYLETLRSRSSR
ncbi:TetR/AcrR family transcriptional regulator [Sinimarinibacterium flocculans]|uniref:TetR/AcrR family transcriptional regulator n=1 Tax=Sinimarinibacterium flocculans TaxID=985250 RepID=UPI002ECEF2CC|nr:TetR/AcrR family transcriptional regulator [Pseudomonadota bacterium]